VLNARIKNIKCDRIEQPGLPSALESYHGGIGREEDVWRNMFPVSIKSFHVWLVGTFSEGIRCLKLNLWNLSEHQVLYAGTFPRTLVELELVIQDYHGKLLLFAPGVLPASLRCLKIEIST